MDTLRIPIAQKLFGWLEEEVAEVNFCDLSYLLKLADIFKLFCLESALNA